MPIQAALFDLCLTALAMMAFCSLLSALSSVAQGAVRKGFEEMLWFAVSISLYPAIF